MHRWAPIPLSLIFKAISVKKSKAISDIAISCFYDCIYIVMPCDMNKLKQYQQQKESNKAIATSIIIQQHHNKTTTALPTITRSGKTAKKD